MEELFFGSLALSLLPHRYQENSLQEKNNSLGDQNDQNEELQCALFQAVDSEILSMRSEIYYMKYVT